MIAVLLVAVVAVPLVLLIVDLVFRGGRPAAGELPLAPSHMAQVARDRPAR